MLRLTLGSGVGLAPQQTKTVERGGKWKFKQRIETVYRAALVRLIQLMHKHLMSPEFGKLELAMKMVFLFSALSGVILQ
jgi:hypothetical protein